MFFLLPKITLNVQVLTSPVDLTQIWKSPNIPKTNSKTNAGKQILHFIVPFWSFRNLLEAMNLLRAFNSLIHQYLLRVLL